MRPPSRLLAAFSLTYAMSAYADSVGNALSRLPSSAMIRGAAEGDAHGETLPRKAQLAYVDILEKDRSFGGDAWMLGCSYGGEIHRRADVELTQKQRLSVAGKSVWIALSLSATGDPVDGKVLAAPNVEGIAQAILSSAMTSNYEPCRFEKGKHAVTAAIVTNYTFTKDGTLKPAPNSILTMLVKKNGYEILPEPES